MHPVVTMGHKYTKPSPHIPPHDKKATYSPSAKVWYLLVEDMTPNTQVFLVTRSVPRAKVDTSGDIVCVYDKRILAEHHAYGLNTFDMPDTYHSYGITERGIAGLKLDLKKKKILLQTEDCSKDHIFSSLWPLTYACS